MQLCDGGAPAGGSRVAPLVPACAPAAGNYEVPGRDADRAESFLAAIHTHIQTARTFVVQTNCKHLYGVYWLLAAATPAAPAATTTTITFVPQQRQPREQLPKHKLLI